MFDETACKMSNDKQKQWIERRKLIATNRHQGCLQVPGTSAKIDLPQKVLKKDIFLKTVRNKIKS